MANNKTARERSFLHDIATPMAVIRIVMNRVRSHVETPTEEWDKAKLQEMITKAHEALVKLERIHADHKAVVSALEAELEESVYSNAA